jgi:hypothetical protein
MEIPESSGTRKTGLPDLFVVKQTKAGRNITKNHKNHQIITNGPKIY